MKTTEELRKALERIREILNRPDRSDAENEAWHTANGVLTRVTQKKNESPSLFVMRTFCHAVSAMGDRELQAMISWMAAKAESLLNERRGLNSPSALLL